MNLTKDMDAVLNRMIELYDQEGIEYSFGEPGTGRILVTDGDEILGELLPVEDVESFSELHSIMNSAHDDEILEGATGEIKMKLPNNAATPMHVRMSSSSYGVGKNSMMAVA